MRSFYNDNDPNCTLWLSRLIEEGHITRGLVDSRSITEPFNDLNLSQYHRAHFFAGIGGWDLALTLAGWPDDIPVWTGSCPCQPFSSAGKRKGTSDPRHLWPDFLRLIALHHPPVIFGEQVASKDGREWLAGVRSDLEALGYVVGSADLCAAGSGAPHIRQRLYWMAHTQCNSKGSGGTPDIAPEDVGEERSGPHVESGRRGPTDRRMDDPQGSGRSISYPNNNGATDAPLDAPPNPVDCSPHRQGQVAGGVDDPSSIRRSGVRRERQVRVAKPGAWGGTYWHPCRDGKLRRVPVEPSLFPLAHGVPGRVGLLRGAGNAIVPPLAATFIYASMEAIGIT